MVERFGVVRPVLDTFVKTSFPADLPQSFATAFIGGILCLRADLDSSW